MWLIPPLIIPNPIKRRDSEQVTPETRHYSVKELTHFVDRYQQLPKDSCYNKIYTLLTGGKSHQLCSQLKGEGSLS